MITIRFAAHTEEDVDALMPMVEAAMVAEILAEHPSS
jgi:hypothetical protein